MDKIHTTSQAWLEDALHQAHDKIGLLTGGQFAFPKLEDIDITCGFPTTKARSVEKKLLVLSDSLVLTLPSLVNLPWTVISKISGQTWLHLSVLIQMINRTN